MKLSAIVIAISSILAVSGCSLLDSRSARASEKTKPVLSSGGYYKDDGPGDSIPGNLAEIPDAVPKAEPLHKGASRPYTALGRDYVPMSDARGFRQTGLASWYGRRYHGKPTSSGEPYDMYAMSAAHPTLPIPSYVRVTNPANDKSVVVRINDRGPFHDERIIDVSYTAAWKLGILKGVTPVVLEALTPQAADSTPVAVETTSLEPLPGTPAKSGTYLQLGAFSSKDGAEAFAQQIRNRMGDLLSGVHCLRTGGLHKVQAGPFNSIPQADQAAELVEREIGIQPFKVIR